MINLVDKRMCCGCEACVNSCPQNCISFDFDEEGFGYPNIDKNKCIDCGKCDSVCPMHKPKERDDDLLLGYIGYARDKEVQKKATSGGIFTEIARNVILEGGVAFGAGFVDDFNVAHVACEKTDDLIKLSGSKYVQSRIGDCYKQVAECLEKGRKVIFCGTPCQVDGLLNCVGYNDRLYTIDLVCRAVPSPLVWKEYFDHLNGQKNGKIKRVSFRDKLVGYQFSHFAVYDDNGMVLYKAGTHLDQYLRAFFSGICNRPSCYECRFKTIRRLSDITIGDCFWADEYGIKDKDGVCTIIVHSEKGKRLLDSAKICAVEMSVNELCSRSYELTNSTGMDSRRDDFFKDIRNSNIKEVLNYYFPTTLHKYLRYYIRLFLKVIGVHDVAKSLIVRWRRNR